MGTDTHHYNHWLFPTFFFIFVVVGIIMVLWPSLYRRTQFFPMALVSYRVMGLITLAFMAYMYFNTDAGPQIRAFVSDLIGRIG